MRQGLRLGDGVTDDTNAIEAAISAAGNANSPGDILFPTGVYVVTRTLLLTKPIRLIGEGNGFVAFNGYASTLGSQIKWGGTIGAGSTVIRFRHINHGGAGMEGITVDSAGRADVGIEIDGCLGMIFKNVTSVSSLGIADMKLHATLGAGAQTMSWSTFINLFLGSTGSGKTSLWIGDVNAGNTCHCTFINLKINHGGTRHAIYLGNCDNNTFIDTFIL